MEQRVKISKLSLQVITSAMSFDPDEAKQNTLNKISNWSLFKLI